VLTVRLDASKASSTLVGNVTAVGAAGGGFLSVIPCGTPLPPSTSTLNVTAGETRAASAIMKLGSDATICVYSSVATDVLVDVSGTLPTDRVSTASAGRILDTRANGIRPANSTTQASLASGVAILNVTEDAAPRSGYLTVWDCVGTAPNVSTTNFAGGAVARANSTTQSFAGGKVCVFNAESTSHVIVDLVAVIS
jgi:hypothetical protein